MILDKVALAAAERVRATAGPRAALYAFDALVKNASSDEGRGEAILRGIECALDVRAHDDAARLAALWPQIHSGAWERRVVEVASRLGDAKLDGAALDLARAEASARPRARGLYLLGRLQERAHALEDAARSYAAAEERAATEGDPSIAAHARLRRAAVVSAYGGHGVHQAAELAKTIEAASLAPPLVLRLARILLGSRSRFVRATGLGHLERLASGAERELRARAAAIGLEHAERSGPNLTPLEADRVAALLKHAGDAPEQRARLSAGERGEAHDLEAAVGKTAEGRALLQRAGAVLKGAGRNMSPPAGASPGLAASWLALDVCAAIADQNRPAAARALLELARLPLAGARTPRPVWTAIALALGVPGMVQKDALALAERLLPLTAEPPARGWAPLGAALARAGRSDLAEIALQHGVRAREQAAETILFEIVRHRAWQAFRRGERDAALAALREARRLAEGKA